MQPINLTSSSDARRSSDRNSLLCVKFRNVRIFYRAEEKEKRKKKKGNRRECARSISL